MDQYYSAVVEWSAEDEEFIALCPEFPGASGSGDSREAAVEELHDAIQVLLEAYAEKGITAPAPRLREEFSGQMRLRLSKEIHREVAAEAERQGVSLNTLLVTYVAQGLGRNRGQEALAAKVESLVAMLGQQALARATSAPTSSVMPSDATLFLVPPTGFSSTPQGNH